MAGRSKNPFTSELSRLSLTSKRFVQTTGTQSFQLKSKIKKSIKLVHSKPPSPSQNWRTQHKGRRAEISNQSEISERNGLHGYLLQLLTSFRLLPTLF